MERLAVVDFPGSGFSDKPLNRLFYILEDSARRLDCFFKGHSPQRVARL